MFINSYEGSTYINMDNWLIVLIVLFLWTGYLTRLILIDRKRQNGRGE